MCEALIDLAGTLADEPDRLGLNTVMKIQEVITNPKPAMTPDQARIEGLKAQVKRSQAAVKDERARQKVKAGQHAFSCYGFCWQQYFLIRQIATNSADHDRNFSVV